MFPLRYREDDVSHKAKGSGGFALHFSRRKAYHLMARNPTTYPITRPRIIKLQYKAFIVPYGGLMSKKEHTFTRFDDELNEIRACVLEMGEQAKLQFEQSVYALLKSDPVIAQQVVEQYYPVKSLAAKIDGLCVTAIARQQPTASDLQSILFAARVAVSLERIAHEANKIARIAERLAQQGFLWKRRCPGIRLAADLAQKTLSESIDSIASLDTSAAHALLDSEDLINAEFNTLFRHLVQSMTEHPQTISSSLEILFVAKAIERVGHCIRHISKLVMTSSSRYDELKLQTATSPDSI
jgi:phosphate transport system protein